MADIATRVEDGPSRRGPVEAETWIFDLDNTLYPVTPAMSAQTNELMGSFIAKFLNVDREEARRIQKSYFRMYGLTIRGLMIHHGLDPRLYMEHMSRIDLSEIRPDPRLADAIERLQGRKMVYTNAFGRHTETVLERLGMTGRFDVIHDIETAEFIPKPDPGAFRELCRRHGIDGNRAVMVEDIPGNLAPAAQIGMTTVWVRTDAAWAHGGDDAHYIDHRVDDLAGWLEQLIPLPHDSRRK